ncbi:MAG: cytochrome b6-f complex iron-sulfur subunit [Desulforhopalus sp.]|jgi:cytochrome b6-f complex iron-sulfur subunit
MSTKLSRRSLIIWTGALAIAYPLLRFVGFTVPRKPIQVEIHKPTPTNGVIITSDFILFDKNDVCWALSRKCTHLGCKLNYLEEVDILECPCHQSKFNSETGAVLEGPAKKSLHFYAVEKRDNDPLYIVTI